MQYTSNKTVWRGQRSQYEGLQTYTVLHFFFFCFFVFVFSYSFLLSHTRKGILIQKFHNVKTNVLIFFLWHNNPSLASLLGVYESHTQLDKHSCYNSSERSARYRGHYLHSTQQTQRKNTSMLSVGLEPAIPAVKQLQACLRPHGHWDQLVFDCTAKCLLYCRLRLCILYIQINCTLLVGACTSLEVLLCEYHLALLCVLLTNNKVNFCFMWDVTLSKLTCNITELSQWHECGLCSINTGCLCLLLSSDVLMCPPCVNSVT